jgi:hypothetical protein
VTEPDARDRTHPRGRVRVKYEPDARDRVGRRSSSGVDAGARREKGTLAYMTPHPQRLISAGRRVGGRCYVSGAHYGPAPPRSAQATALRVRITGPPRASRVRLHLHGPRLPSTQSAGRPAVRPRPHCRPRPTTGGPRCLDAGRSRLRRWTGAADLSNTQGVVWALGGRERDRVVVRTAKMWAGWTLKALGRMAPAMRRRRRSMAASRRGGRDSTTRARMAVCVRPWLSSLALAFDLPLTHRCAVD